jgi:hypothetical protein
VVGPAMLAYRPGRVVGMPSQCLLDQTLSMLSGSIVVVVLFLFLLLVDVLRVGLLLLLVLVVLCLFVVFCCSSEKCLFRLLHERIAISRRTKSQRMLSKKYFSHLFRCYRPVFYDSQFLLVSRVIDLRSDRPCALNAYQSTFPSEEQSKVEVQW